MDALRSMRWVVCALVLAGAVARAMAEEDTYWINSEGGDWLVSQNWSNGLPSLAGERNAWVGTSALSGAVTLSGAGSALWAYIGETYDAEVTLGTNAALAVESLALGWWEGAEGTLRLSGANAALVAEAYQYVGIEGEGRLIQTGGTNTCVGTWWGGNIYVGYAATAEGSYRLAVESSATALQTKRLYVGYEGTGEFLHEGGIATVTAALIVGSEEGSEGTYTLSGTSRLTVADEWGGGTTLIGFWGTGEFAQSGESVHTTGSLYLGCVDGASGTYLLEGGSLAAYSETLGGYGAGAFIQTGGRNTVEGACPCRPGRRCRARTPCPAAPSRPAP